jgi:hypothetical protein
MSEDNHEALRSGFSGANLDSEFLQAQASNRLTSTSESQRPLEVMREGRDRMAQWGLSHDQIEQLEQMTASYEYANPLGRAERIAAEGGIVMNDDAGEWVVLPDFFDYTGSRRDGQCSEIAAKQIAELHASGWLRATNSDLEARGRASLVPWYCTGQSFTHFNRPDSKHIWAALAPAGQNPADSGLILDASFRKIDAFEHSEYRAAEQHPDPPRFTAATAMECRVAKVEAGTLPAARAAILGVTEDNFYSIGLIFVRPPDDDRIVPVLGSIAPNGVAADCHLSPQGEVIWHGGQAPLAARHREDLEQILRAVSTIRFRHDEDKARRLVAERQQLEIVK